MVKKLQVSKLDTEPPCKSQKKHAKHITDDDTSVVDVNDTKIQYVLDSNEASPDEEEKQQQGNKLLKQETLAWLIKKPTGPGPAAFTQENLLHMVTQFVVVENQVRLTVKITLRFILTSLCPSRSLLLKKQNFKIALLP
jgi:hypothetical protein